MLKHYRPFRCIPCMVESAATQRLLLKRSVPKRQGSRTLFGLVMGVALCWAAVPAGAQNAATNSASNASIEVANRRAQEAFARDDYTSALTWFRKSADQGDAYGQAGVGIIYLNGYGVAKNYAQALIWLRKAAQQGVPMAQMELGTMYAEGWGIREDDAEAAVWIRKAAEQGLPAAQHLMGLMYREGKGLSKDDGQARGWLRKAADQGYEDAKTILADMDSAIPSSPVNPDVPKSVPFVLSPDAIKLRCVADNLPNVFLTVDLAKEGVDYGGDVFFNGKSERDPSGISFMYDVKFNNDNIVFHKYKGKALLYGGELDRRSLVLSTVFGDGVGLASLVLVPSGGIPKMQCEKLRKQL